MKRKVRWLRYTYKKLYESIKPNPTGQISIYIDLLTTASMSIPYGAPKTLFLFLFLSQAHRDLRFSKFTQQKEKKNVVFTRLRWLKSRNFLLRNEIYQRLFETVAALAARSR